MVELTTKFAGLVQEIGASLSGLPYWAALLLLFAPTLLALVTRSIAAVAAAGLLSIAGVALVAAGPHITPAGVGGILAVTAALLASVHALHDRQRRKRDAAIEQRLDHLHEQVMVFLGAVDRRTAELDRISSEARKASEQARAVLMAAQQAPAARPPSPKQIVVTKTEAPAQSDNPESSV